MNPWWKDFLMRLLLMVMTLVILVSIVGFAGFLAMCFRLLFQ